eukprot:268074-Rhodomonas_salina.2
MVPRYCARSHILAREVQISRYKIPVLYWASRARISALAIRSGTVRNTHHRRRSTSTSSSIVPNCTTSSS